MFACGVRSRLVSVNLNLPLTTVGSNPAWKFEKKSCYEAIQLAYETSVVLHRSSL